MSIPFHRSLRALAADGAHRSRRRLVLSTVLCSAWAVWFLLFRISVYAVSSGARVEVGGAMHPIEPVVDGRVVSSKLALDRQVEAGEVLVQLDTQALDIELAGKQQLVANLASQQEILEQEIKTRTQALAEHERVTQTQLAEARARQQGASAEADLARTEAQRSAFLKEQGVLSVAALDKVMAEERQKGATAREMQVSVGRIGAENRLKREELQTELASLGRVLESLRGQQAQEQAAIEALRHDIDLRSIRAPANGRLGEIVVLQPGSVVSKGLQLGAVVPPGGLQVTAYFPPDVALGRVRPLQQARLRLDGFPWAEYGMLPLSVESVGSEVRDGKVRVELRIVGSTPAAIPLQHGLPGSVEVEVDRASPAELVLRAAGRMLARRPASGNTGA